MPTRDAVQAESGRLTMCTLRSTCVPLPVPLVRQTRRSVVGTLAHVGAVVALLVSGTAAHAADGTFQETTYISGLASPTASAFAPDGRLFVCEKGGSVRVITSGGELLTQPFLTIAASVIQTSGERGLLGIAFDPDFHLNRSIYVYYTYQTGIDGNRVSRFTADAADPDVAVPGSELFILDGMPQGNNHNAGAIHFGPDRKLYVATGDVGTSTNAQSLSSIAGKILRIDPAAYPNIIPPDNPFVGTPGARGEIWAYGLRNPFTFAFNGAGTLMYINDVGQGAWEEINQGAAGKNYGWPNCEGPQGTGNGQCTNPAFTYPIHAYDHALGNAITGGAFYEAAQFPAEYANNYFFADYTDGWIRSRTPAGVVSVFWPTTVTPVDLQVGPDGSLYYLSIVQGAVGRIRFIPDNAAPVAVINAGPTIGPAPLSVTFDGRNSSDPDNHPLTYLWGFGDGSASSAQPLVVHTYTAAGPYTASLTVDDGHGAQDTALQVIQVGNPPVGTILTPSPDTLYSAGETINYSGTASDPEDGTLPPSAFSWTIVFHHGTHTHPFQGPISGVTSGSFQVPVTGEAATDVSYRIHLTVTDSGGLKHESILAVSPRTSTITLDTAPFGLALTLDGQPVTVPHSTPSVVGHLRTLGAVSPQLLTGDTYVFGSWSDGGTQTHAVATPAVDTTYLATFSETGVVNAPKERYLTFGDSDGALDHVHVANTADVAGSAPLTVMAWFKVATNGSNMYLVTKGRSGQEQWLLRRVGSNGKIVFNVRNAAGTMAGADSAPNTGGDFAWHHAAGVWDGAALKLYIDGSDATTTTAAQTSMRSDDEPICIGALAASSTACSTGSGWKGALDDVRIYDQALTQSDIQAQMDVELAGNEPGLLAYWKLNDGTGQTAVDSASLGLDGRLGTTAGVDTSDPSWETNLLPDITPPAVSIAAPAPGQTVSGVISVAADASDDRGVVGVQFKLNGIALGSEDLAAPYQVAWDTTATANGGKTLTATARDAAGNATTSVPVNVTVANVDSTPPVISGVAASGITVSGATITWDTNEPANSQVQYGTTTAYGFATTLDPVLATAHSQLLTGLQGATLYHYRVRSADGAGNWTVGGDRTFTTMASSPKQRHLLFSNAGGALDHVYVANTADVAETSPLTVMAWFKVAVGGSTMHIVSKGRGGAEQWTLRRVGSNGRIAFNVRSASGTMAVANSPTSTGSDMAWHHAAGVWDGATLRVYIDGSDANSIVGTQTSMRDDDEPICIGSLASNPTACATSDGWQGSIDDVRIHGAALSQAQIQAAMNAEATGTEPGLIAYWRLNEGSGQTALDAGPGARHGRLGTSTGVDSSDPARIIQP